MEGCWFAPWRSVGAWCQVAESLSPPLSVLCHYVALTDCIRSAYVGGQLPITRNILSCFFSERRLLVIICCKLKSDNEPINIMKRIRVDTPIPIALHITSEPVPLFYNVSALGHHQVITMNTVEATQEQYIRRV